MTTASLERARVVHREMMLVHVAALAAGGAPPSSDLLHLGAAAEVGCRLATGGSDARRPRSAAAPLPNEVVESRCSVDRSCLPATRVVEDRAGEVVDDDEAIAVVGQFDRTPGSLFTAKVRELIGQIVR
jgi:hypothetical protein